MSTSYKSRSKYLPTDGRPLITGGLTAEDDVELHSRACADFLRERLISLTLEPTEAANILARMGALGAVVAMELAADLPDPIRRRLQRELYAAVNRPRLCHSLQWQAFYSLGRAQLAARR